jgi:hypothetical protein
LEEFCGKIRLQRLPSGANPFAMKNAVRLRAAASRHPRTVMVFVMVLARTGVTPG